MGFVYDNFVSLFIALRLPEKSSQMDKFVVKRPRAIGPEGSAPEAKRYRNLKWGNRDPLSCIAWNCNGLPVRLSSAEDASALRSFMNSWQPDIFCLSEVRIPAHCASSGAKRGDGLPRMRSRLACTDKKQQADKILVENLLSLPMFCGYRAYFSLADYKYAGTAVLVHRDVVSKPSLVRYNLDPGSPPEQHDSEGRVIYLEWKCLAVLHTYSPNNGFNEKGFKRRREWDRKVKQFLVNRRTDGVQVVWCGDLNVAPTDLDLSHPAYYKRQYAAGAPRPAPDCLGQPGCTPGERDGFAEILHAGGLTDLYRELSPGNAEDDVSQPIYSWRGANPGKHHGRGMRLDHFVGPKSLVERLDSVKICGRGIERDGFLGSDHSPVVLKLRENKKEA